MNRPTIATVFGILHIIIGILFLLMGVSGLIMGQMGGGGGFGGGVNQQEIDAAIAKSFPGYTTFDLVSKVLSIVFPLLLIVAGIMLLKMNPTGRLLSILYGLAGLVWGVVFIFIYVTYVLPAMQPLMAKVMNEQMEKAAKQQGGKMNPQQKQMAENMGQTMGNIASYTPVCCGGVGMIYPLVVLLCMLFSSSLKNMGSTSRMDVLPGPENQPDDGWGRQ
jgi:hypothetical protein